MGLMFLEKEESRTPTFEIQVRTLDLNPIFKVTGGLKYVKISLKLISIISWTFGLIPTNPAQVYL